MTVRSIIFQTFAISSALFLFAFSFSFTFAEEANQTSAMQSIVPNVATQTLIPGSVSCETPAVSSLKTYVYGGSLHSFEFVVSDASQVALAGSVGGSEIPFHQISRVAGEGGSVKMFATISSTLISADLPVSVTMLSSSGSGQPVCVTTVLFVLHGSGVDLESFVSGANSDEKEETATEPIGKRIGTIFSTLLGSGKGGGDEGDTKEKDFGVGVKEAVNVHAHDDKEPEERKGWRESLAGLTKVEGDSIIKKTGMVAAAKDAATGVCTTENGASRTWMLLLAAYVIGALLLHSRGGRALKDPLILNAALVVPFLALVAFWYFVPECRVGWWTLGGSVVIALVAVFGKLYWPLGDKGKKDNPWTAFHP